MPYALIDREKRFREEGSSFVLKTIEGKIIRPRGKKVVGTTF